MSGGSTDRRRAADRRFILAFWLVLVAAALSPAAAAHAATPSPQPESVTTPTPAARRPSRPLIGPERLVLNPPAPAIIPRIRF